MQQYFRIAKNGPMDAPNAFTFLHNLISIPTLLLLTLNSPNVFIIENTHFRALYKSQFPGMSICRINISHHSADHAQTRHFARPP